MSAMRPLTLKEIMTPTKREKDLERLRRRYPRASRELTESELLSRSEKKLQERERYLALEYVKFIHCSGVTKM